MHPAGFNPVIKRLQTQTLYRTDRGLGSQFVVILYFRVILQKNEQRILTQNMIKHVLRTDLYACEVQTAL